MFLTLKNLGISIFVWLQILTQSKNVRGTLTFQPKKFSCLKRIRLKCTFPEEFCNRGSCLPCSPECNKPYQAVPYGCEVFCSKDVKASSNSTVKCPIMKSQKGEMESSCSGDMGSSCNITCKTAYGENYDGSTVWCLPNGNWTQDIATLCQTGSGKIGNILIRIVEYGGVVLGVIAITVIVLKLRKRCKGNGRDKVDTADEKMKMHNKETVEEKRKDRKGYCCNHYVVCIRQDNEYAAEEKVPMQPAEEQNAKYGGSNTASLPNVCADRDEVSSSVID